MAKNTILLPLLRMGSPDLSIFDAYNTLTGIIDNEVVALMIGGICVDKGVVLYIIIILE